MIIYYFINKFHAQMWTKHFIKITGILFVNVIYVIILSHTILVLYYINYNDNNIKRLIKVQVKWYLKK